ncbi:transcriptional regulator NrdR [Synechococcus sp. PCC 7336]|uniref:transcriptional regulator NrdR n=1 Tax=Synechococcus sp. PCC 7336 TaxID=195250 RepID=UPI000477917C|nr:transcriptional regulator NrdR [Synechococcus sp. PCC 7336]
MKCPKCSSANIRVLESRSAEAGQSVRRRRECMECKFRFTTYERIEFVPIMVIKRDGSRESFDRNKIFKGVMRSCEKTAVSVKAMEGLVESIEEKLQLADRQEVTSKEIGEMVLEQLQPLSEVAYVRFASVYRKFQGVRDFMTELGNFSNSVDGVDRVPSDRESTSQQSTSVVV